MATSFSGAGKKRGAKLPHHKYTFVVSTPRNAKSVYDTSVYSGRIYKWEKVMLMYGILHQGVTSLCGMCHCTIITLFLHSGKLLLVMIQLEGNSFGCLGGRTPR